ncbi:MAG: hypothetical protein H6765_03500 [Candidatus Peribacteria bacterium]|nr:MAG: hypothetical protein H6765_03500 [Candidatus Peribacteria bacterium]
MLRRFLLRLFLLLVTLGIFAYVFLLTTADEVDLERFYESVPGVQYV